MIILIKHSEGVSIMRLVDESADLAAEISKWEAASNLVALSHQETTDADVPSDRAFRNAWKIGVSGIETDMPAARKILKDKMRAARKPRLEQLDVDLMVELEKNGGAAVPPIAAKKKKLRDVTADPAIEAATTEAELRAAWPVELLGEF